MTRLGDLLARARATGDLACLVEAIPASRFLGIAVEHQGGDLLYRLRYAPHLIGNSLIPALHGGTLGALLETTATLQLMWESGAAHAPRIVNITVEFLRTARPVDTLARAEITRQGRRVATVRVAAWQDDPTRPVAAANAHFLLAREAEAPPPPGAPQGSGAA